MTPHLVEPDIAVLKALSRLLMQQVRDLEAARNAAESLDVRALVIHAQTSRSGVLQRLQGEIGRLGAAPETDAESHARPRLCNGQSESDESVLDAVVHGEAALCVAFQRGVQDQRLMPHTRHFLRDLLDRLTATAERYGEQQH
jgi:hypothetical protein